MIGRTGRPSSAAYATYTGAASVEVASADKARHRLSRAGDRQLNSALHTIAVTQLVPHQTDYHIIDVFSSSCDTPRPVQDPGLTGVAPARQGVPPTIPDSGQACVADEW